MSDRNNAPMALHEWLFPALYLAAVVLLVVLKCCGVVSWSWLWVLAPVWVVFVIIVLGGAHA